MKQKFTLIELLITISILAILAALLLPAFHSARSKGRYAPSEGHLDLRQTAWYVLPQTGIMGGRHGT